VQNNWVDVRPIRPHDRSKLFVDLNLSEKTGVVEEWFEHRTSEEIPDVDIPRRSVIERKPQYEVIERFDGGDVNKRRWRHGSGGNFIKRETGFSLTPAPRRY
jgi:hypothetical protein